MSVTNSGTSDGRKPRTIPCHVRLMAAIAEMMDGFCPGHLDRVVHGITAEEILDACDEKTDVTVGDRLSNPTISITQAVRLAVHTFKLVIT